MRLLLLLMNLLWACASADVPGDPAGLVLRIDNGRHAAGDPVTLVLTNGSNEAAGYNLCPSVLSRESSGEWIAVPSDRVCTMELRSLEPGAEDRMTLELPADLTPGRYRFETTVFGWETDLQSTLRTEAFEVDG